MTAKVAFVSIYIIILLIFSFVFWRYFDSVRQENGEKVMKVRSYLLVPIVIFIILAYATLGIQPLVYATTNYYSGINGRDVFTVLKYIIFAFQLILFIFAPITMLPELLSRGINKEILGSERIDSDFKKVNDLIIFVTLLAFVVSNGLLFWIHFS